MPFKEGAAASRLVSEVEISEMEISEVEISKVEIFEVEISEREISDTGTLGRRWSFSTTPSSRLVQYRERAAPPSCAQSCAQFFFWLRTQRILHIHVTVGRRFSQQQALDLFVGRPCCVCRLLSAARHRARRQHRRAVRSPCMHDRFLSFSADTADAADTRRHRCGLTISSDPFFSSCWMRLCSWPGCG